MINLLATGDKGPLLDQTVGTGSFEPNRFASVISPRAGNLLLLQTQANNYET